MKKSLIIVSLLLNIALLAAVFYLCKHQPDKSMRDDKECVMSWNNCIKKLDMQADVVFFGDSHTAYGDWQRSFPEIKSINLGYMGEDTKGMLRRVEVIRSVHPRKVFLMAGLNGLGDQTAAEFESAYCTLVDSILSAVPDAVLYIENILPVNDDVYLNKKVIEANRIIQKIAEERKLIYIDLYSLYAINSELPTDVTNDGVHLKSEAYNLWYESVNPFIR